MNSGLQGFEFSKMFQKYYTDISNSNKEENPNEYFHTHFTKNL